MKRILRIILPLAAACAILVAGTLVPQRLISAQRQNTLSETQSVEAAEVHPYGEAYQTTLERLLEEATLLGQYEEDAISQDTISWEYGDPTEAEASAGESTDTTPVSSWTEEETAAYAAAYEKLIDFCTQWDSVNQSLYLLSPKLKLAASEGFTGTLYRYCLEQPGVGTGTRLYGLNLQYYAEGAGGSGRDIQWDLDLVFDPDTGAPLALSGFLTNTGVYATKQSLDSLPNLAGDLAAAYTGCTGLNLSDNLTVNIDSYGEDNLALSFTSYSADSQLELSGNISWNTDDQGWDYLDITAELGLPQ